MTTILQPLADLFYPRLCPVCKRALSRHESGICLHCLPHLPVTNYHLWPGNPIEQLFWGSIPIERATALFHFISESPHREIIHAIKYKREASLGETLGFNYASELARAALFEDVTAVVPVPLHPKKLRERGYNQSLFIARGVARALKKPLLANTLRRIHYSESQTAHTRLERFIHTENIFACLPLSAGSHLLLVDDVITTGATLIACGKAIKESTPDCRISILTLAATKEY